MVQAEQWLARRLRPAQYLPFLQRPLGRTARLIAPSALPSLALLGLLAFAVAVQSAANRPPIPSAHVQFDQWAGRQLGPRRATPSAEMLLQGRELALSRRQAMRELMAHDPERAWALAATPERLSQLPPEWASQFEQHIEGRGSFSVLVGESIGQPGHQVTREIWLRGQRYQAYVFGTDLAQSSDPDLPLRGIVLDGLMVARLEPVTAADPGRPPHQQAMLAAAEVQASPTETEAAPNLPPSPEAWSCGSKTVLFVRVSFPDDPAEPCSQSTAEALLAKAADWFGRTSCGATELIPAVTPLLTLPYAKSHYAALGYNPGSGPSILLDHARAAACQAGFDPDRYDLDIVQHRSVPGFAYTGLAVIRGKGLWLQCSSSDVLIHELGHNYGLWHANFWGATQDSIIGPGENHEYGDTFDVMGATGQAAETTFNAFFKHQLGWLPDSSVLAVQASGIYRLHAADAPGIVPGRAFALSVRKDQERYYWCEFRPGTSNNAALQQGVLLHWNPWTRSGGGTQLLDTTPGSPLGKSDSALTLGNTFSDPGAGIHLTPLAQGGTDPDRWIDLQIHLGSFPDNHPPVLSLSADRGQADVGETVRLLAQAQDPDGDDLAYSWSFGDWLPGTNSPEVEKSWAAANEYVVRCVVSDMKGGQTSASILIRVGACVTYRIRGRITDSQGLPLPGVRVDNGRGLPIYRGGFTDSDGSYTIILNAPGSCQLVAAKYGYSLRPAGAWTNPFWVASDLAGIDFIGDPLPALRLDAPANQALESTSLGPQCGHFSIWRLGPTNDPLTVRIQMGGTATPLVDYYTTPAINIASNIFVIPAGAQSLDLVVHPLPDQLADGGETVILTLVEHADYTLAPLAQAALVIQDSPWDQWRSEHFSGLELGSPAAGDLGNPDGDDYVNLWEYAFGLDPNLKDHTAAFQASLQTLQGLPQLVVSYRRRLPPSDLLYQIETSEDLRQWLPATDQFTELCPPKLDPAGTAETVQLKLRQAPAPATRKFVRLKVTRLVAP